MQPAPPSASLKNEEIGKTNGNSRPNDREREEEEEKLANEFLASPLGRVIGLTDEQLEAIAGGSRAPTNPDNPPCDGCSKPFAGTMQCGRCESVFYCGRTCQLAHWSPKHKAECKKLKARNEETAGRVLEQFKQFRDWTVLDVAGAYKAAVRQGLHDKIREVLELDKADIVDRFLDDRGSCICYTHCVISVLFRGNRAEGRAPGYNPTVNGVDGPRVKGYVRSHPEALDAWLQASVQLIRAATHRAMLHKPNLHQAAHDAAWDVWAAWSMAFTCSTASRAILAPFPSPARGATSGGGGGGGAESTEQRRKRREDHARGIVTTLGEAIRIAESVSDPRLDPVRYMESSVSLVAALVHVRTQEYGIGIDVEGILNLNDEQKETFQHIEIPMAKRMIEKGGMLNARESQAIMALSSRRLGLH